MGLSPPLSSNKTPLTSLVIPVWDVISHDYKDEKKTEGEVPLIITQDLEESRRRKGETEKVTLKQERNRTLVCIIIFDFLSRYHYKTGKVRVLQSSQKLHHLICAKVWEMNLGPPQAGASRALVIVS